MRFALLVSLLIGGPAFAQNRFAERTPASRFSQSHTMERSGDSRRVAPWAVRSLTRYEAGAYVGLRTLRGNSMMMQGSATATGPMNDGTFGMDFAGFRLRMGRVFLAPSADPSVGQKIARGYRHNGPHVPDIFALRPFRQAVLEKKEDMEEHRGEHEK